MRTALDRLLARPSALRLLRSLTAQDLSLIALPLCRTSRSKALPSRTIVQTQKYTSSAFFSPEYAVDDQRFKRDDLVPSAANSESEATLPANPTQITIDKWAEIVHFKQRLYGNDGTQAVWKELRKGHVDLPITGQWAQPLWEIFLANDEILEDVVVYATDLKSRTGFFYELLYESVVSRCFAESRYSDVYKWHLKLVSNFPPPDGALRRIAPKVSGDHASWKAFRYIYLRSNQRDVYDALLTSLCDSHRWLAAVKFHKLLIRHGDLPANSAQEAWWIGNLQNLVGKSWHPRTPDEPPLTSEGPPTVHFSRETMNRVLGEVHGVQPKKLDDHFCARIFATKAFSIDVIIRGLGMFGVEEIGPVALREMATRTVEAEDISYNIRRLNEAGITIGNSVYSQALKKFAQDGRQDLIDALLSTDQHPDAFEDAELQRKLLTSFVDRGDWNEVHRTLAILTVFHQEPVREQWNLLVQKLSVLQHVSKLSKVLEDMQSRRIPLTDASMSALQVYQLRHRNRGKAPVQRELSYDDVLLIANIWRSTLVSGGDVNPRRWAEVFRRFGMTERFDDVVKLALWLADWYLYDKANRPRALYGRLPRDMSQFATTIYRVLQPTHPGHPLRQIFSDKQIRAFISWGIRRAFVWPSPTNPHESQKPPHYWAQGLRLCRALRQRGIAVSTSIVRAELRLQLVHLFGRGRSKRVYNRRSAANNFHSLLEMIEYANQLWIEIAGKPLLDPEELVSGWTGHHGIWWVKRMRRDVLEDLDTTLRVRNTKESPKNSQRETYNESGDYGQTDRYLTLTRGTEAEDKDIPTPADDDSRHMSVLGFSLGKPITHELAQAELIAESANGRQQVRLENRDKAAQTQEDGENSGNISIQSADDNVLRWPSGKDKNDSPKPPS